MNNARRKAIEKVIMEIEGIDAALDEIACDEQDALENMPESLQFSDKGEDMQSNIDTLEDARGELDNIRDNLLELTGAL